MVVAKKANVSPTSGPQLEDATTGRLLVQTITPDGKEMSHAAYDNADAAMRAFVDATRVDFGKELGAGSYVALTDIKMNLDASKIAEGKGTYRIQFKKEVGRLAFEAMENLVQTEDAKVSLLGDQDGVVVAQCEAGGYSVAFDFDRELTKMMDRVSGASFDKTAKAYLVPETSFGVLSKVVLAMRHETRLAESALDGIMMLATASGVQAQNAMGANEEVKPQVSTYREPGKFYGGEIVNVNSHYAAQLSGFGNKDGAAFIAVHRLADIDRDLMKGDQVGIRYDSKFFGAVSDLSKNMSVPELTAHFEANNGKHINGVSVMDLGDKIGLAFDIHPVLVPRIRMVEGAAFNRDEGFWEVPKEKQEFALRAAEDMRKEFALDEKEVEMLKGVAADKIDGAKMFKAFTREGSSYAGGVLEVGERYALQKTGRDGFTLHHLSTLDQVPGKGQNVSIRYNKGGAGVVVDQDLKRAQGQARDGR